MAKRKALTKKIRFEVFKRDKFTCQYCGTRAPDALLVVDHIKPVGKGGTNEILNLVVACQPCNAGKGPRELGDTTVVEKQRSQIEELQERREQIEMMLEWKRGVMGLDGEVASGVASIWNEMTPGWVVSVSQRRDLGKWIRKYSVEEVLSALRVAADQYLRFDENNDVTIESYKYAWEKVLGVLKVQLRAKKDPWIHDYYKLRARVVGAFSYAVDWRVRELLQGALRVGVRPDELHEIISDAKSWGAWQEFVGEATDVASRSVAT